MSRYFPAAIPFFFLILLCSCIGGSGVPSNLPESSALRDQMEMQRMEELKETQKLRLGVPAGTQENVLEELKKKCSTKKYILEIISCDESWLTGWLRTGKLDMIYLPDLSSDRGQQMGFFSVPGGFFLRNEFLFQYLYGP